MSIADEKFFEENLLNINKMVSRILVFTNLVPLAFIILSAVGLWIVPLRYSLHVLAFTLIVSIVQLILSRNEKFQVFLMYFGIIATVLFVDLLGYKNIINISVSYALAPFLACLYYNKRLTNTTLIVNYITVIIVMWIRAKSAFFIDGLYDPRYTSFMNMFLSTSIGMTIESLFVFLISNAITNRSYKTLCNFMDAQCERDDLFEKNQKRNEDIEKLNSDLEQKNSELQETQYRIIQFVASCLGSHDLFTGRHVIHTQRYVEIICKDLVSNGYYKDELTEETINLFRTAAFLHDIGKIHIPEGILNKIGKFTPAEFEMMESHTEEGYKLLVALPPIENGTFNEIAKQMALCHHEKWDGSGYPKGLSKTDIPLCARIMAAADVLDALISQRLYKDPMSIDEAMVVFENSSGSHFEECIAQSVINCKKMIAIIDQDFKAAESKENAEELQWWQEYHGLNKNIMPS